MCLQVRKKKGKVLPDTEAVGWLWLAITDKETTLQRKGGVLNAWLHPSSMGPAF